MRRSCLYMMSLLCLPLFAVVGRAEQGDWGDPSWQLLRQAHIHRDGASLAAYLREQCGDDADLKRIDALVRQLGSGDFDERESAEKALTAAGPAALAQLRAARSDADAEIARRAGECVARVEEKWKPEQVLAAVRVLVRRGPEEAVPTLLRFLPYADFEELQDEVWFGLDTLVVRQSKVDPSLVEALQDAVAVRRAVAACIVGRRGDADQRATVHKLLDDPEPEVRLRAAQGLLAANDPAAVPALPALLEGTPLGTAWQAEELLRYVAGPEAPPAILGAGAAGDRRACREAWEAWWKERGPKIDLAKLDQTSRRPGLMLLCDGGLSEEATGRVWLLGCDSVTRWELPKLAYPSDARLIAGGQVVVAERGVAPAVAVPLAPLPRKGGLVSARGFDGKVLWQYRGIDDPMLCQPLADERILIAGPKLVIAEVDAAGKELYSKSFAVRAFPDHRYALPDEYPNAKEEWRIVARRRNDESHNWEWAEVESGAAVAPMPGPEWGGNCQLSRYGLISLAYERSGVVAEPAASIVGHANPAPNTGIWVPWFWKRWMPGALHVADLPNGRVLVGGMGRVVEIDSEGRAVWSVSFEDQAQRVQSCLNRVRLGFDAPRGEVELEAPSDWLQGLASKDAAVRRRTAVAIVQAGRWATEASYPSLTPLLKDSDEAVRDAAQRTLNDLKPDIPSEALRALKDEVAQVRRDADEHLYLARCRPTRMGEIMMDLLKDENPKTRWLAARGLGHRDRDQERSIAALIAAARDDEDTDVRQIAVRTLMGYGKEAKAAIPTLLESLKKDPENRRWTEMALGAIDPLDERVFPVLMQAAQTEADWAAVHGLARCQRRAKEVIPVFIKLLQAGHQAGKPESLNDPTDILPLLGGFGPEAKAAVPTLIEILRDKSVKPGVRFEAARALGDIGAEAKEAIPDLENAKGADDIGRAAAEALEKIQDN